MCVYAGVNAVQDRSPTGPQPTLSTHYTAGPVSQAHGRGITRAQLRESP